MNKKVLLIDGNSFCYRAFYAIRSLSTSKGQPTNAVYGFVAMLNKLITQQKPDYLAVAFDLKGPTFRHKKFADYKVQRKPMPDDLSVQLPVIKRVLHAYRIPIFEKKGYEADDVIATLAKRLSQTKAEILIVTGDKDILQLVSSNIKVINPHKDDLVLDEGWVKKRFGVAPDKITEIMALAGDASDNIPGVPGIGEATAVELIKQFGTLDEVLANTDKIKNKARAEKIKEFASLAQMSRELTRLDSDITHLAETEPGQLLGQLKIVEADKKELFEIFKELEFKSLMEKAAEEFKDETGYKVISDTKEIEEYFKKLAKKDTITFYPAGGRPDPVTAKISGIAFTFERTKPAFFSFADISKDALKLILENKNIKKIGHNLKYAKVLFSNYGITLEGMSFDTMIAAYLLDPAKLKYGLGDLALEYLNCKLGDLPDAGLSRPQADTENEAAELACQNVTIIFRLSKTLKEKLKEKSLLSLFENIEMPLAGVLADMEREGVTLDKKLLLELSGDFEKKLNSLTREIYEMAGGSFNINSPKQLSSVLFDKLKLPRIKRTKTGSSTDTEVLRKLTSVHPLAQRLLEFREISKLKSTYVEGMMKLLKSSSSGKIHTSFNQTGTATGRLSSSQPNLQNIPIRTALGRKIRRVFVPSAGDSFLLSADYSQIELRILAHLSEDKGLISAFKEDLDIHAYTASLIFNVSVDKVSRQMRSAAKTVNFGIIYGMGAYALSKDLGIKQAQAEEFIEAYFQRYPGVRNYVKRQTEKAAKDGFVTTLMKRRRYIPQIQSPDESMRRFAQRMAINAPVQGSASDLIKAAMVNIHNALIKQGHRAKMIIQVHDELVFSLPEEELEALSLLVKDKMENVIKLKVPIKVSIKSGKNWLEVK
ncbi:MAG: DNA polymerase I [Candidatus Omnitrophota bacterium]|nr:MAG: DNA polymerase I [Candidatus Omnitrophota bacterium]